MAILTDTIAAVRHDGRQRDTQCPAHEDRRASLSVGLGERGRVLVHCQAGCSFDAILEAAQLARADLRPTVNGTKPTIAATYDYTDERGALQFQVCRLEPKDFRQRRPAGAGGWTWKLGDVRRVLYRLPALQGQPCVFVVEGEKDADRLAALGLAATTNAGGAGKWRDDYARQLHAAGARTVIVLPDADEPGRKHAASVAATCRAVGMEARILELPDLPPKGDVSDWLDAGHSVEELLELARGPVVQRSPAKRTLAHVEATFAKWIRDDDPVPTRAVLAAYVANRKLDGDPIWLMLVGGSGVGKTERLTPLSVMPDVVLESSITGPAALLSGTPRRDKSKDATGGLLRKLPDGGGILLLKDFTSIIDMHRDARAEVLAALREVYDGRWDRSIGADGGRTLTWTGRLGLVAGCTTAIDSAHTVVSIMGTRFMLIRLKGDPDIAGSAFDHVGHERPMRDELRAAVRELLDDLPGEPFDKQDARASVIALAQYVALARSPVDRDTQGEIRLVLDPEAPTRIVKMLAQLWRAAGMLGLDRDGAWELVRRVGLDSIPKLRRAILDYLAGRMLAPTTTEIAEHVEHPSRTTRRALEDLTAHRVARRIAGGDGKADRWELTDQTRRWIDLVTLPVSSDSTQQPAATFPLSYTEQSSDDKTGKVAPDACPGCSDPDCAWCDGPDREARA
jgi:hypothetical protein